MSWEYTTYLSTIPWQFCFLSYLFYTNLKQFGFFFNSRVFFSVLRCGVYPQKDTDSGRRKKRNKCKWKLLTRCESTSLTGRQTLSANRTIFRACLPNFRSCVRWVCKGCSEYSTWNSRTWCQRRLSSRICLSQVCHSKWLKKLQSAVPTYTLYSNFSRRSFENQYNAIISGYTWSLPACTYNIFR